MKKWKKVLIAFLAVIVLSATIGMFDVGTVSAIELHRSNGLNSQGLDSRAWGNVVGQNGANFRVRHYRRYPNGGTSFISQSGWGTSGVTVRTAWYMRPSVLAAAVLANVSTW